MKKLTLTLKEIKKHGPCYNGWHKALKSLGKTRADNTEITFDWIVANNGVSDAIWALRCLPENEMWRARLFARRCAQRVLHLWDAPQHVKDYLDTGDESLRAAAGDAAGDAARAAARAAAWAATRAAARAAAWAAAEAAAWAARAAAWAAAGDAAWDAAWDAAGDAAWDAAWDAAEAAEREAQGKLLLEIMAMEKPR